jgi:cell division protein ZapA
MKHEVTVRLFNRDYNLVTEESKEYTDQLAAALNRRMEEMTGGKSTLSVQDAAALIALETFDTLHKLRINQENIRSQIKVYFDDANQAKARAEAAEKENAELKQKLDQLQKEIKLRKSFVPEEDISAKEMIAKDISEALGSDYADHSSLLNKKK